ncbi:hypothetical protein [Streptomyces fructofermentans]|uniref:Uncharacterized protein n=1 Tax=Streptomyces fructofermentans TaxID=152141 RepID=A0A918NTD1_9ACTN|nr:hypothetical protein [Streptomyces fructofermentans]GGX93291.1 hypothetical protein GCM10010515_70280 [Streptomyces fructofermentans]
MTSPRKAPWILARFAQAAIAVVAVADVLRVMAVRDHYPQNTGASQRTSALASTVFVNLMALAIVLFLAWLDRAGRGLRAAGVGSRLRERCDGRTASERNSASRFMTPRAGPGAGLRGRQIVGVRKAPPERGLRGAVGRGPMYRS